MIKFSAFADEISDDFKEQVSFLVSEQIANIEIRSLNHKNIMDLNKDELTDVRQMLHDNGISVSAIGSPIGKIKLDQPFETHLDRFRHAIELAAFFNAPYIRVFSYYAPDGEDIDGFRDEVLRRMRIHADLLKGSDIIMVHENEAHIYGHNAENCVDIASSVDSPNLKLVYDPANFVWSGNIVNNMEVCWPQMEPYVVHVHIKDWKHGSTNIGSIPGQGDAQIQELIKKLAEIDYNGFLTLEPHLESGGQFGGSSGAGLFKKALEATRNICDEENLKYS